MSEGGSVLMRDVRIVDETGIEAPIVTASGDADLFPGHEMIDSPPASV